MNVEPIVRRFGAFPKKSIRVASAYILFLLTEHKHHDQVSAAQFAQINQSNISRFLSAINRTDHAHVFLNRSSRRTLKAINRRKGIGLDGKIAIIIDATMCGRIGNVENIVKQKSGSKYICGHKFINIAVLTSETLIPIDCLSYYSKSYAKEHGIEFKTEHELVQEWVSKLPKNNIFPLDLNYKNVLFLLDSGYDVKFIQQVILDINANFLGCAKTCRSMGGKQAHKYFSQSSVGKFKSIQQHVGAGKKNKKEFSVKTADSISLKGVGKINAVCSKMKRRNSKRMSKKKYLICSDLNIKGNDIINWYSLRWAIETWHKTMKQKYGYRDCKATSFNSVESHVKMSIGAYCLRIADTDASSLSIEDSSVLKVCRVVKKKLSQIGNLDNVKSYMGQVIDKIDSKKSV